MAQCPDCRLEDDHQRGSTDCPAQRIGTTIAGKYKILRLMGAGGMAAVYEAQHLKLKKPVAVKIIHNRLAARELLLQRFRREAQSVAGLSHPGIIRVEDLGENEDRVPYMVMELLQGRDLARLLKEKGVLEIEQVTEIGISLLDALAAAHFAGIIHRDIKPDNLFMVVLPDRRGQLKVLDFGIARVIADRITQSGSDGLMGTPVYMSPEQFSSTASVDHRADIYSTGATLFNLLTGMLPVTGDMPQICGNILTGNVKRHPREIRPDVPAWLDDVVAKAMAKDPDRRFQNAGEMKEALERGLEAWRRARGQAKYGGPRWRWGQWIGAAAVVFIGAAVAVLGMAKLLGTGKNESIVLNLDVFPRDATIVCGGERVAAGSRTVRILSSQDCQISAQGYVAEIHSFEELKKQGVLRIRLEEDEIIVQVDVTPRDAVVTCGGEPAAADSKMVHLRWGQGCDISAAGYVTESRSFDVLKKTKALRVMLKEDNLTVRIDVTPRDAIITCDGTRVAASEKTVVVKPTQGCRIAASGYMMQRRSFEEIKKAGVLRARLEEETLTLQLDVTPRDAAVVCGGKRIGAGAKTVRLMRSQRCQIYAVGYVPVSRSYEDLNGNKVLLAHLEKASLTLPLNITPRNANVICNGEQVASGAKTVVVKPDGKCEIFAAGYVTQHLTFEELQGKQELSVTLKEESITLRIDVQPNDATIVCGGEHVEPRAKTIRLKVGQGCQVTAAGYLPANRSFAVLKKDSALWVRLKQASITVPLDVTPLGATVFCNRERVATNVKTVVVKPGQDCMIIAAGYQTERRSFEDIVKEQALKVALKRAEDVPELIPKK